jgi:hypothetical protein
MISMRLPTVSFAIVLCRHAAARARQAGREAHRDRIREDGDDLKR